MNDVHYATFVYGLYAFSSRRHGFMTRARPHGAPRLSGMKTSTPGSPFSEPAPLTSTYRVTLRHSSDKSRTLWPASLIGAELGRDLQVSARPGDKPESARVDRSTSKPAERSTNFTDARRRPPMPPTSRATHSSAMPTCGLHAALVRMSRTSVSIERRIAARVGRAAGSPRRLDHRRGWRTTTTTSVAIKRDHTLGSFLVRDRNTPGIRNRPGLS